MKNKDEMIKVVKQWYSNITNMHSRHKHVLYTN
jgi:hypothetical protein